MVFIASKAKVNAAGKINISSRFSFTGLNDSAYRGALARMPADKRREFLEGLAKDTFPGGKSGGEKHSFTERYPCGRDQ